MSHLPAISDSPHAAQPLEEFFTVDALTILELPRPLSILLSISRVCIPPKFSVERDYHLTNRT